MSPPNPSPVSALHLTTLFAAHRDVPWPAFENRDAWQALAQTPHGTMMAQVTARRADELASQPIVPPSFLEALEYQRTGSRKAWQHKSSTVRHRATTGVLAACLSGAARHVDFAAEALWSLCEMATWVWPAHNHHTNLPDSPGIDLGAAMMAQQIAETLQLLGPAFSALSDYNPDIVLLARRRLREEVFVPYLERDFGWMWPAPSRPVLNNWNAVCSGGVLAAALGALDDEPELQARVVARAIESLSHFAPTFGDDGALDEGVSYWVFGFGHYVMAAERLLARSGGEIDLLAHPKWREVAQFPVRVNFYGHIYPNFSDCPLRVSPAPGWLFWLGRHLDLPAVSEWAARLDSDAVHDDKYLLLPHTLRNLLWSRDAPTVAPTRSLSVFFPNVEWLVARSNTSDDALILAAKGGHNHESHNHNDGGSFIVHFKGEALIDEIGAPTYTRQFFHGPRYENIAARSLGHSVPFVNGCEQSPGRDSAARVLDSGDGFLALDLAGFYALEAGLISLHRTLRLSRDDAPHGAISLCDEAAFSADSATLALPLIARDCALEVVGPGQARIVGKRSALEIVWPASQAVCRAETIATDDPLLVDENGASRLRRLWFDVAVMGRAAKLELTLRPVEI